MNTDTGFYRALKPGEAVQEGDQYFDGSQWLLTNNAGGRVAGVGEYRRPIAAPEYRALEVGEEIQAGDEFWASTDRWMRSACIGEIYRVTMDHYEHRRPVTQLTMVEPDPAVRTYVMPDAFLNPADPKGEAGKLKCPLHLLPAAAMEETAFVHLHGAEKYGPYNWRSSNVCASTYVAAIMRHLNAWREGEDLDAESGRSHIAHIAASCNILMDAQKHGHLIDDRVKP